MRDSVGVDIEKEARQILPNDNRVDGFTNTAYSLKVDLKHIQSYAKLAEIVVEKMDVAAFAKEHGLSGKVTDKLSASAINNFVSRAGEWLLRGPLDSTESDQFLRIGELVKKASGNSIEAASYIVEAMLQSPRFIYRIENQHGDGGLWPISDFELASRISYIIWGSAPDKELLALARNNELFGSQLNQQIERMLRDPRAIDRSNQFVSQWLNINRLQFLRPSKTRYPNWNSDLAAAMADETLAYFNFIVWEKQRAISAVLNSKFTFASPQLAKHYGIDSKLATEIGQVGLSFPRSLRCMTCQRSHIEEEY